MIIQIESLLGASCSVKYSDSYYADLGIDPPETLTTSGSEHNIKAVKNSDNFMLTLPFDDESKE